MYGGAGVLDSRSDVVGGTLYHEEVAYGDQRLAPDPATAAVVPWADATARFICDSQWHDGRSPGCDCRATCSGACSTGAGSRLRADDRVRAGVLPADASTEPAVPGLPHLQHGPEHLRPHHPTDGRAACQTFGFEHHHRELRVRRLPVGDQLHARDRDGRPRRDVHVQECGEGARHLHGYRATFMAKPFSGWAGVWMPRAREPALDTDAGENVRRTTPIADGTRRPAVSSSPGSLRHARSASTRSSLRP